MNRRRYTHWVAPGLLFVAVLASCGGGDNGGPTPLPEPSPAIVIAKTSSNTGDTQSGGVGQPLANPLRVVVTEDGAPMSGASVVWATTAAGGSVDPGSAPTEADGVATTTWTLGTASGAQTASATLSGATGSPVTFTATASAGAAAALAEVGGDGQTGEINTQLALPLQAMVSDQFGNGVAGVSVDWSATGATLPAPTTTSDAAGISQTSVTLGGTAGPITIVAQSDGLQGSPLAFSATAVEPTPIPTSISVSVRNDNFLSGRNGTLNPAVDTVQVGGTVTWTWAVSATNPHDVTSSGPPNFTSSTTTSAPASHSFTFTAAGTYIYYCTQHGAGAPSPGGMWGRIVVR